MLKEFRSCWEALGGFDFGIKEFRFGRKAELPRSGTSQPADQLVVDHLANLLVAARDQRRRAGAMDAIIAATALAPDLSVWSHDGDFEVLADLAPELRVRRG